MTKPEPPPQQWASLLSSRLSSVSNWDPLGIALDEPPPSMSVATKSEDERPLTLMDPLPQLRPARAELAILTKAVIEVIEDAQGLPYARGTANPSPSPSPSPSPNPNPSPDPKPNQVRARHRPQLVSEGAQRVPARVQGRRAGGA